MEISSHKKGLLKLLPGVDTLMEKIKQQASGADVPQTVIVKAIRLVINSLRDQILMADDRIGEEFVSEQKIIKQISDQIKSEMSPNLCRVINATGVVVHTNLGRSLLSCDAIKEMAIISGSYSNLEFDLDTGKRGSRYTAVENLICDVCGCEAAMVVNNNAAAVLLCLDTLARGKEVIVSRGELVEIGGSFRIPDVMLKSGSVLKEVGTTNRTHLKDYQNAISDHTALLLKVHTSNYAIIGFTKSVSLKELVKLGADMGFPVMEDLGSGMFVDFSKYGLPKEPTVQESLLAGTDIVTFSGDKLLGGPQAGIICGKTDIIENIRKNPLTRALRIDKLTLSALEHTLRLYRDEEKAIKAIPTLNMLTMPFDTIEKKAVRMKSILNGLNNPLLKTTLIDLPSKAGGGSLPALNIPSKCVGLSIEGVSANKIETHMRCCAIPVIGRIEDDVFVMDMRTVMENEFPVIKDAINDLLNTIKSPHMQ
ncbi:MAG: L-seryl-tRNA(Sec) selenium transferase [Proteobacteria bacterium]|nr:L-seryl-tRNA(Sec) selenium transferase [Pseudomonadota bacterium]